MRNTNHALERQLGFRSHELLTRRATDGPIKTLQEETLRIVDQYSTFSTDIVPLHVPLRNDLQATFSRLGPQIWSDSKERYEYLVEARENDLEGWYPQNLFYSVPNDRAQLQDLFQKWIQLKVIRRIGNVRNGLVKRRGPHAASETPKKRSSSITSNSDSDLSEASHVLRDSSRTSVDLEDEDEDTPTESDFETRPRPRSQRLGAGAFRGTRSMRRKRQSSPDERESSPDEIPARPPKRVRTTRDLEAATRTTLTRLVKLKISSAKLARFAKHTAAGESSRRGLRGSGSSSDQKPPQPPLNSAQSTTQDGTTVAAGVNPPVDRTMPPPSFGKGGTSARSSAAKSGENGRRADIAADHGGQRGRLNVFSSSFGGSNNSSTTRRNAIDRMPSLSEPPCQASGSRGLQVGVSNLLNLSNLFTPSLNDTQHPTNAGIPLREPAALNNAHRPAHPESISSANDRTRAQDTPPTPTPQSLELDSAQPTQKAASMVQGTPSSAVGDASDLFENAQILINWDAGVQDPTYLGMENCATAEDFFRLVEEYRPLPLQDQRIKALAIDTVTEIEGPKADCRIIRDDRLGRAGLRRMKKVLLKQCEEHEELELEIRVEWD